MVSVCEKCYRQAHKLILLCYVMIQEAVDHKIRLPKIVEDTYLLLAQRIAKTTPHISAAGCFIIDYTFLYSLLTTTVSFLLVLLQFNKENEDKN